MLVEKLYGRSVHLADAGVRGHAFRVDGELHLVEGMLVALGDAFLRRVDALSCIYESAMRWARAQGSDLEVAETLEGLVEELAVERVILGCNDHDGFLWVTRTETSEDEEKAFFEMERGRKERFRGFCRRVCPVRM